MVLEVDDIVATFAQLKENGVTIIDEPSQQSMAGGPSSPIRTATATAFTNSEQVADIYTSVLRLPTLCGRIVRY